MVKSRCLQTSCSKMHYQTGFNVISDILTLQMIVMVSVGLPYASSADLQKDCPAPVCCLELGMRSMSLLHADYHPRLPA